MRQLKFEDISNKSEFVVIEVDDFEYVNPLEKIGEMCITSSINLVTNHLLFSLRNGLLPSATRSTNPNIIIERLARKTALTDWQKRLTEIENEILPTGLIDILSSPKKEQSKILKRVSLSTNELITFIIRAWGFGYTFSQYRIELPPKGLDITQMPIFAYKEDSGSLTTMGGTLLSNGQIKNAINHRSVRVVKFLDNGKAWHCFFLTYKSVTGEEAYKGGPHIHFISHTWGLTREYVLNQLRSRDYKLPAIHVGYHTHRNPRSKTD